MKPLRLAMTAFGPYVDEQIIDFEALIANGLFLITGPIGAGKTTILDAICYALYGESSGDERKAQTMRSQFASPDRPTQVALDFAIGDKRYRIVRSPEQMVAKKRGSGETRRLPAASLLDRSACQAVTEDGVLLASRTDAVNAEVTRLLGFSASQFRQVIMLPQGKFREFLASTTSAREAVLKVLFDVSRCERLEDISRQRREALDAVARQREEHRKLLLGSYTDPEALAEAIRAAEKSIDGLVQEEHAVLQAAANARQALDAGRSAKTAHANLQKALADVADLERQHTGINARRQEVKVAESAWPVIPRLDEADRKAEALLECGKTLQREQADAGNAAAAAQAAVDMARQAGARQADAERLRQESLTLQHLVPKLRQLEIVRGESVTTDKACREKQSVLLALQEDLSTAKTAVKEAEEALPALQAGAARKESLGAALRTLRQLLDDRKALDSDILKLNRHLSGIDDARDSLQKAEKACLDAQAARDTVQAAWMGSRAGQLAAQLQPGDACPVCGSKEHPKPAATVSEEASDAALEKAEKTLGIRRIGVDDARAALNDKESLTAAARARVNTLKDQLCAYAAKGHEDIRKEIAESESQITAAASAARLMEEANKEITGNKQRIAGAEAGIAALQPILGELQSQSRSLSDQMAGLRNEIGPDWSDPGALAKEIEARQGQAKSIDSAIEASRKALEAAERRVAEIRGRIAVMEVAMKNAGQTADAVRQEVAELLNRAGFASPGACRTAFRSPVNLELLRKDIRDYENAVASASGRLNKAVEDVAGRPVPDMPAIDEASVAADRAAREATIKLTEQRKDLKALQECMERIHASDEEERSERGRHAALRAVAEAVAGRNRHGVRFSTFALAAYLDEVLQQASHRLRLMSGGRYTVQRAQPGGGRGFQGLDLEVFDEATGQSRPAVTLSGGESFLASLSLALGLADTVQAVAGGRRLESVFIDEGFGSLDAPSLDLAQRCVADIQATGRLVGLISHVDDMRNWTPARIEIAKTMQGSTVTVVS